MVAPRRRLAAYGLVSLLIAGMAAPAAAGAKSSKPHSEHLETWLMWPDADGWPPNLEVQEFQPLKQWRVLEDFRPRHYREGRVSSDHPPAGDMLGVADSIATSRAERVRIRIEDLLRNDLGWQCDWPCKPSKSNKLKLTALAKSDNIKSIVHQGKFLYVEADEERKKSTFTYQVLDRKSGATADVQVNIWFGNRAPKAKKDKLVAFANIENVFDAADLLRNDRDHDGDLLDLVRVWCPKDGRVFLREVDGQLKVFFQPDENFTGVTYFKYTIADLSDPEDILVAGPGAPSPERKSFAEGIVRLRVLASPS